jgi:hypothetical protein
MGEITQKELKRLWQGEATGRRYDNFPLCFYSFGN